MAKKSFLARKSTSIYLKTYLGVLTLMFFIPISYMFIFEKNAIMFSANILFFEMNMFLSIVLSFYTYFTRDENKHWKLYVLYFVVSFIFLISSMLILGSNIYI